MIYQVNYIYIIVFNYLYAVVNYFFLLLLNYHNFWVENKVL